MTPILFETHDAPTGVAPPVEKQIRRLIQLGLPVLAGLSVPEFAALAADAPLAEGGVVMVHPDLVPPSQLAPLLERSGKPGFVVVDMTDLDAFGPIDGVDVPRHPLYTLSGLDRGDEMRAWSPAEALDRIDGLGRRALTVGEGISWLLQRPELLEPNHCFMTVASRKRRRTGTGFDARVPAIWISNGTGRDSRAAEGAPKVGWCWENNRHSWLGFASADRPTRD